LEYLQNIQFDVDDFKKDIGTKKLVNDGDKAKTLMARWRFPSLSLHGIQVNQLLIFLKLNLTVLNSQISVFLSRN
jgi:hypothetical protein